MELKSNETKKLTAEEVEAEVKEKKHEKKSEQSVAEVEIPTIFDKVETEIKKDKDEEKKDLKNVKSMSDKEVEAAVNTEN